jgi:hypothetical protein
MAQAWFGGNARDGKIRRRIGVVRREEPGERAGERDGDDVRWLASLVEVSVPMVEEVLVVPNDRQSLDESR